MITALYYIKHYDNTIMTYCITLGIMIISFEKYKSLLKSSYTEDCQLYNIK